LAISWCWSLLLLYPLIGVFIGYYLYKDAQSRGDKNAEAWIFIGFFLTVIALLMYYISDRQERPVPTQYGYPPQQPGQYPQPPPYQQYPPQQPAPYPQAPPPQGQAPQGQYPPSPYPVQQPPPGYPSQQPYAPPAQPQPSATPQESMEEPRKPKEPYQYPPLEE
jgi:hypothetical protein